MEGDGQQVGTRLRKSCQKLYIYIVWSKYLLSQIPATFLVPVHVLAALMLKLREQPVFFVLVFLISDSESAYILNAEGNTAPNTVREIVDQERAKALFTNIIDKM